MSALAFYSFLNRQTRLCFGVKISTVLAYCTNHSSPTQFLLTSPQRDQCWTDHHWLMKRQDHKQWWTSGHCHNLRPQEKKSWKEEGEEAHVSCWAARFTVHSSERAWVGTCKPWSDRESLRRQLWALSHGAWQGERKNTKESKNLCFIPSFATNSQSLTSESFCFLPYLSDKYTK